MDKDDGPAPFVPHIHMQTMAPRSAEGSRVAFVPTCDVCGLVVSACQGEHRGSGPRLDALDDLGEELARRRDLSTRDLASKVKGDLAALDILREIDP